MVGVIDPFDLIGSPTRRRLLALLHTPCTATAMAKSLGVTRQAVHEHLRAMVDGGLVVQRPGSRPRAFVYEKSSEGLARLGESLRKVAAPALPRPTRPFARPGGTPGLVVAEQHGTRWIALPDRSSVVLGRQGQLPLAVPSDPFLSERHARFEAGQGMWTVCDLGSTNGTFLNGTRVEAGAPLPLSDQDVVRAGMTFAVFHAH